MTGRTRPSLDVLEWIDSHAPALCSLAALTPSHGGDRVLEMQLFFYLLWSDLHPDLREVLLALLADETSWLLPRTDILQRVKQLSAQLENAALSALFEIPERQLRESLGDMFVHLLSELIPLKPRTRWAVTELLGLLIPPDIPARLRAVHAQVDADETRLLRLLRRLNSETARPSRRRTGEMAQLKALAKAPVDESWQPFVAHVGLAVRQVPKLGRDELLIASWQRFLSQVPAALGDLRLGLFVGWEKARTSNREVVASHPQPPVRSDSARSSDWSPRRKLGPTHSLGPLWPIRRAGAKRNSSRT